MTREDVIAWILAFGRPGPQGEKGDPGLPGDKGAQGDPGTQGQQGVPGPFGPTGSQGSKGDKGDRGEQGPKGPKGDIGLTGDEGPMGPPGPPGGRGPKGLVGSGGSVSGGGAHPDLATHDALGLATDAELTTHAATPHGGAPTTADYLVGTAQAGLSAEIVVGTTPGGELHGTWAVPLVDTLHAGDTHADATNTAIADAAIDAASRVTAHEAAAPSAHTAGNIPFIPAVGIIADSVQAAIEEVANDAINAYSAVAYIKWNFD